MVQSGGQHTGRKCGELVCRGRGIHEYARQGLGGKRITPPSLNVDTHWSHTLSRSWSRWIGVRAISRWGVGDGCEDPDPGMFSD